MSHQFNLPHVDSNQGAEKSQQGKHVKNFLNAGFNYIILIIIEHKFVQNEKMIRA